MSARTRLIVGIAIALIVCLLFYFLFVRSRQSELDQVNQDIAAEQDRTAQLQSELSRLRDLQSRAPELRAELDEIRRLVPQNHEIANFIFLVQEAANEAGVDFVEISPELPKPPPEGAPLAEVRAIIIADGGYFAIQDFVRRLYDLDRALRIDLVQISGEEDPDTGEVLTDLNITSRIFFEPTGATGGATTTTAPVPAPAPAATPTPTPTP